jgi:hypothetical protein
VDVENEDEIFNLPAYEGEDNMARKPSQKVIVSFQKSPTFLREISTSICLTLSQLLKTT